MNTQDNSGIEVPIEESNVCVSIAFSATNLMPNEITQKLGIQPSISYSRGDTYQGHINKTEIGIRSRSRGVWLFQSSDYVKVSDVNSHVSFLVDTFQSKRAELQGILVNKDVDCVIRVWIESCEQVNSFGIDASQMVFLASICREVAFSIIVSN